MFTLPAATAAGPAAEPITIAQSIDLSGPDGALGRDYVAGIKTYFDMVNSAGGIHGRRLQYVVRDDGGVPSAAVQAVSEFIERDQAEVLLGGVGELSTRAVLASPAFRRSGQLLYAPLAAADYGLESGVLFWRPSYRQEIRHVLDHFAKLGIKDVAVAYQESDSSQLAYRSLQQELRERSLNLTAAARISSNGEVPTVQAMQLAASRPGLVLVLADTIGTALFLKEYRRQGSQTFVAGTSLINLATLRELAGPKALEWTVFSQVVPNPVAGTSTLQLEHLSMMRKYRDEEVSSLTLEGFAVAKALVLALRQSANSRLALREFMTRGGSVDLGGLAVSPSPKTNRLSGYLDIALFRKGTALLF